MASGTGTQPLPHGDAHSLSEDLAPWGLHKILSVPASWVPGLQGGSMVPLIWARLPGTGVEEPQANPVLGLRASSRFVPRTPAWLCRPWQSMPSCPMLAVSTSLCPWPPPTWTTRRLSGCTGPTRRFCRQRWYGSQGWGWGPVACPPMCDYGGITVSSLPRSPASPQGCL